MLKAVLFDLDGTLLQMDNDIFIGTYFKGISKKLIPYGYDPESLISGIWTGTEAMLRNNGEKSNEEAFWDRFTEIFGERAREDEPIFREFYENEFQNVKAVSTFTPKSREIVEYVKSKDLRIALATNPIFPAIATESRIRWAGLEPEDFELYTTYENINYSKPNPAYYAEILRRMDLRPDETLMVGNDVVDDGAAAKLGMSVFYLTNFLINKDNMDLSALPHGDFDDLRAYIEAKI